MKRTVTWQAWNFVLVGAVGFAVDGGILLLLHESFDFGLVVSRCISFPCAVTVTWLLNRQRTFSDRKNALAGREWGRYAVVNGVGALLNLALFLWLVARFRAFEEWPLLALAAAATVAMTFNFLASRHIAFGRPAS